MSFLSQLFNTRFFLAYISKHCTTKYDYVPLLFFQKRVVEGVLFFSDADCFLNNNHKSKNLSIKKSFFFKKSSSGRDIVILLHAAFIVWWLLDNKYKRYNRLFFCETYLTCIITDFMEHFENQLEQLFGIQNKRVKDIVSTVNLDLFLLCLKGYQEASFFSSNINYLEKLK